MEQYFLKFPEKRTTLRGIPKISEINYPEFRSIWLSSWNFRNFRWNSSLLGNSTMTIFFWNLFQEIALPYWSPFRNYNSTLPPSITIFGITAYGTSVTSKPHLPLLISKGKGLGTKLFTSVTPRNSPTFVVLAPRTGQSKICLIQFYMHEMAV